MMKKLTIEELINDKSVTRKEINELLNCDIAKYVYVDINVFNTGAVINLVALVQLDDLDDGLLGDDWNGYDFVIEYDEFINELERLGTVMDVQHNGTLCWIPNIK